MVFVNRETSTCRAHCGWATRPLLSNAARHGSMPSASPGAAQYNTAFPWFLIIVRCFMIPRLSDFYSTHWAPRDVILMRGRGHEPVALTEPRAPRPSLPKYRIKENAMCHRGNAKLPTYNSLMHHPTGSPWYSPVAQSGGTEVQVLTSCQKSYY